MCLILTTNPKLDKKKAFYQVKGPNGKVLLGGKKVVIDVENKQLSSVYISHKYTFAPDGWVIPASTSQSVEVKFKVPIVRLKGDYLSQSFGRSFDAALGYHLLPLSQNKPLFQYLGARIWHIPVLFCPIDIEVSNGHDVIVETWKPVLTRKAIEQYIPWEKMGFRLYDQNREKMLNEIFQTFSKEEVKP